ncbi:unnamed protein product, partial [Brassica oleracea]
MCRPCILLWYVLVDTDLTSDDDFNGGEMYVMSAKNKRVSNQILGGYKIQDKLSRFEELNNASLPYLGVISLGVSSDLGLVLPNLKLLDLTGNLISVWEVLFCMSCMVMSKLNDKPEEIKLLHPALDYRLKELKKLHGLDVERALAENPLSKEYSVWTYLYVYIKPITLKCVGPSIGEKPPLTDKLPGSITVITNHNFQVFFFRQNTTDESQ